MGVQPSGLGTAALAGGWGRQGQGGYKRPLETFWSFVVYFLEAEGSLESAPLQREEKPLHSGSLVAEATEPT